MAAFDRDIVEGGLLTKALAAGSHVKEIMQENNTTLGAYLSILPEEIVFDKFLREDPGLLTGPTFKERLSKAKDKYQEFFAEHVLPTAPNPGDVFKEIFDEQVKQQFGEKGPSIIPQVDASNLGPHGVIFRDLATDLKTLREVASCDAGCKDGVGLHPPFVRRSRSKLQGAGQGLGYSRQSHRQCCRIRLRATGDLPVRKGAQR